MKYKSSILLVLLTLLAVIAGCTPAISSAPASIASFDPADITLETYTSRQFGFTGLAPSGWVEFNPGLFQPAIPGATPTLFGQARLADITAEKLVKLVALPEPTGILETANLTWETYSLDQQIPDEAALIMELALAETSDGLYLAVLGALHADHATLREVLFVPALEALIPAPLSGDRAEAQPTASPLPPLTEGLAPLDTQIRAADGMVMVFVPAGDFEMGSNAIWRWQGNIHDVSLGLGAFTDQWPQHTVYLDAYWIDQTPVTAAMFREFIQATGYSTKAESEGYGHPYRPGPREEEWPKVPGADWQHPQGSGSQAEDDHPVVQVSWEDAAAYCAWTGGSLPTEAQWEKACRGIEARIYPWGDDFDPRRLNYCDAGCPVERWNDPSYDDGHALTSPVGAFPEGRSSYGALDMAGNVWEWTADRYDEEYYLQSPYPNPLGPEAGSDRVQRGGAWFDGGRAGWLTCTIRHATQPDNWADDLGFRCAFPAQ